MSDQQAWHAGTIRLGELLAGLTEESGQLLRPLLLQYQETKTAIADITAEIDAALVCAECAGKCCANGKYRFSVLDRLVCLVEDVAVETAFAQKPLCPYGTATGCQLGSSLRPLDCVLFICDDIDRSVPQHARSRLVELELQARNVLRAATRLFGVPLATPLLLWAEQLAEH